MKVKIIYEQNGKPVFYRTENNIYLGTRKLSEIEQKYFNDTYLWNIIYNIKLLKNLENELKS